MDTYIQLADLLWLCWVSAVDTHSDGDTHKRTHTQFDPSVSSSVSSKAAADVPLLTLSDVSLR